MNSLILISLTISEFFEIHSFSISSVSYFMLLGVFVLFNKKITITKTICQRS
ncbi:hypothetical protein PTRA_a2990 [Pseudoalteromonas translucida KMM 520]|uniref:Uncharacterized protein n=1 Tax=Pseudoalteromonas translucida KMM 520 TaxID=1315283 RepID=A0A0U2VKR4_9GAMM|nr:hypothetical protein PTRA_a2990 [Pseudoalteromonas translucida KMM 520]